MAAPSHPAKTSFVATATPGLTNTAGKRRQIKRRGKFLADAAHQPRPRIEADRHVGAGGARRLVEARIGGRESVGARQEPQRRGGVRRAAAKPSGNRQFLVEMEGARGEAGNARSQRARGLEHQIVRIGAGFRPPGIRPLSVSARRPASSSSGRRQSANTTRLEIS